MGERDEPDHDPADPREVKRRHQERHGPPPGLVFLRDLVVEERRWLRDMVRATAATHRVDADDLEQDLAEGLLGCEVVDRGRRELRGWLRRRAEWRARDLARSHRRRDEREVAEARSRTTAGGGAPDASWDAARLMALGLSRDQAQVLLLTLWGVDLSLRDFATEVARKPATVRKDRQRGLDKVEALFDLCAEERLALRVFRRTGSRAAAAAHLGWTEDAVRRHVDSAQIKIDQALGTIPEDHRGGRSDAQ